MLHPHALLRNNLGDNTRTDRLAAFTHGEVAADFHSHRLVQAHGDGGVIARQHHLDPVRQQHFARDIGRPEEELRFVTAEERRVPSPFGLAQDVNLTLELRTRPNRPRRGNDLAALDAVTLNAA